MKTVNGTVADRGHSFFSMTVLAGAVTLALTLAAAPAAAQHANHATNGIEADSAIPLFNNLGPHTRTITTRDPAAQAYFIQGMRLQYGFGVNEARRSFEVAIRQDPECAMCHWGLAWSLGPYVNGGMDSVNAVRAYEHVRHAQRLARRTSDVERALIDALGTRYVARPTSENRAQLDTMYMNAMRNVVARFPDDLDAATLFAESIMVLRPWDYWTAGGLPQPGIEELLAVLEGVLARDLAHPGACHLYIHATEASTEPRRAEACADLLIDGMPGASHMRHMPSHTYMRIGRYADGVRSNQLAWIADQQAEHGGATAIYPAHNLHMLLFAAAYDGQSAVSMQAARDLARMSSFSSYQLPLVLARFGRWDEILELPLPEVPFRAAMLHYARGMAQLRSDQVSNARASLAALETFRPTMSSKHQRNLLGLAGAILAAEIDAANGDHDVAINTLQAARTIETDSLQYDEPEDWIVPLRQVLGAIMLDAGRAADAEREYRGELEEHPENGWSLIGLARALEMQGRADEAAAVLERFRTAWSRADVHITASRF
jgi:tetratricopeptide (TPR) repeat protein